MRRARREPGLVRRLQEQLVDPHALGVLRLRLERQQHQQRHDDGAAPIRDLVEMERKPLRQQHHLGRHHRHRAPGDLPVERKQRAGEHVGAGGAAARADRLAGAAHVLGVDRIADHLEREIGLHARAHVEGAFVEQRPAAVRALDAAQIDRDLAFELGVDRLAAEVAHQHVFGRNGGVGLELEHPMPVRLLAVEQRAGGPLNAVLQSGIAVGRQSSARDVAFLGDSTLRDEIGGAAPGSNGTFDGGGQAGICPIAGQEQIGKSRVRPGP